jgi:hypothetical protein
MNAVRTVQTQMLNILRSIFLVLVLLAIDTSHGATPSVLDLGTSPTRDGGSGAGQKLWINSVSTVKADH